MNNFHEEVDCSTDSAASDSLAGLIASPVLEPSAAKHRRSEIYSDCVVPRLVPRLLLHQLRRGFHDAELNVDGANHFADGAPLRPEPRSAKYATRTSQDHGTRCADPMRERSGHQASKGSHP